MAKMMTYKEANTVLESSLTPNARCICKKTAIDNHAVASRLSAFVNNRLVPASMVVLITYSIQFKDWDGTILSTQTVKYGHKPTKPANPTRTGYTFTGWSNNPDSAPTGDTVYTAQYQINSYTIRFLDYNGTVLKTQSVNYGSTPTPPSNPSRTGYSFTGWSPSITAATQNRDYTAQYTINSFTVTFLDGNGGVFSTQTVSYGGYASAPSSNPTKTGYIFTGWSPNPSSTPITSNTTFSPTWENDPRVPDYYVTFNYNGGIDDDGSTGPMVKGYDEGSSFYHADGPHLTWNGQGRKRFMRWEANPTSDTPSNGTPMYRNYTLYAQWDNVEDDETFYVQYILWKTLREDDPSYGPGNTTTRTEYDYITGLHFGDPIPRPRPGDPSEEGYQFMGWGVDFENDTVDNNMTINGSLIPDDFYGPQQYTVRFVIPAAYNNSGRDIYDGAPYEMGETITCPINYYTSDTDATFLGWDVNGTLKQPGDTITCTGTADYYASYQDSVNPGDQITITFKDSLNHNSSSSITRSLSNGSYTLQSGDFPTWSSSITHNGYAYTAHNPFWDHSAGDILTSSTDITATYDPTVNNSKYYNFFDHPMFGSTLLYHGNVNNDDDPITALGVQDPSHEGYTFKEWSGPTETQHVGSTSWDYYAAYTQNENTYSTTVSLLYRSEYTDAQDMSGSVTATSGGYGESAYISAGGSCTFSITSATHPGDISIHIDVNGIESDTTTFWGDDVTFWVEDFMTNPEDEPGGETGGGNTGGNSGGNNPVDPYDHEQDPENPNPEQNNPGQNNNPGTGGESGGTTGGQDTHEQDPNVNPGGNEGGDTGGGGNNEGGNTGGSTGPDTEDHDPEELEP